MLYLALPIDLRDRYKNSLWLVYAKQIQQTKFTEEDVIVLSEWTVTNRAEMVDLILNIRQQRARVIYIGSVENENIEWKRQLVLMGVFDWVFFDSDVVLGKIDALIESPRNARDVSDYLSTSEARVMDMPLVVDYIEEDGQSSVDYLPPDDKDDAEASGGKLLDRIKGIGGVLNRNKQRQDDSVEAHPPVATQVLTSSQEEGVPKRFVWPNPEPVRIQILGDGGVGKSFVAWNLAASCDAKELPSTVIEEDVMQLQQWAGLDGIHIHDKEPKKGYRVHIHTGTEPMSNADLYVLVSFPDSYRIERTRIKIQDLELSDKKIVWVINHHWPELPLMSELPEPIVVLPHDARQIGAVMVKRPLAISDKTFASRLEPIVSIVSDLFVENAKRGNK